MENMMSRNSTVFADKQIREEAIKEKGSVNRGRPGLLESKKDEIVIMYNNGNPLKEIAESFDVRLSTICKVIRERKK